MFLCVWECVWLLGRKGDEREWRVFKWRKSGTIYEC